MKLKNILILAGGDGTRFQPLSDKNTFPFFGKPLVFDLIKAIKMYAENIIVVTNPANDTLVKEQTPQKIQTIVVPDPSHSNMGKAVLLCKELIKGEVLVLNAVDIFDFIILKDIIKKLPQKSDFIFIAKELKEYFPGAYVAFDGKKVKGFIEKPPPEEVPSNITKLVADYFSDFSRFVGILEKTTTEHDDLYETAINTYIQTYPKVDYVTYNDYWYTLKFPWHVLPMMKYFLSKKSHIGKNVKISGSAKIVEPVYIGDNTVIGDYTLVRESHIGNNCIIGGHNEVARSYIGNSCMLHRNYVGDSILDENVLMGAGTVTANFRFDGKTIQSKVGDKKIDTKLQKFGAVIGKEAKIGVNSTIFPGVKIGMNTFVGPGEVITVDIGNDKFLINGKINTNKLT